MNKLKVAIQELRDHLGSDGCGKNLLDVVTEIANAQRKRLVTLEETAEASQAAAKSSRQELDSIRAQLTVTKDYLRRETARLESARSRVRTLEGKLQALTEPEPEPEPDSGCNDSRLVRLLKAVRRRFPRLPVRSKGENILVAEDFVEKFTFDEYANLGMVAAACAMIGQPIAIVSEKPSTGRGIEDKDLRRFTEWFRDGIYTSPLEDKLLEAANRRWSGTKTRLTKVLDRRKE